MASCIQEIYSSGGVGDALIVACKIQNTYQPLLPPPMIRWEHYEKHACHKAPITQIVDSVADFGGGFIHETPESFARERCEKNGGEYLNTNIARYHLPYLLQPLGYGEWKRSANFICVQLIAGRLHDGTRREISQDVVKWLLYLFPEYHLVLLGPKPIVQSFDVFQNSRVVDLTDKTPNILEAFNIIDQCAMFVGQDGVLAYYAAMMRKMVVISYHIPSLVGHYWNQQWATHGMAIIGAGHELKRLPHEAEQKLIAYASNCSRKS